MSDNILVRWESENGWREGVLCVVCCHHDTLMVPHNMREAVKRGSFGTGVIWDRTRNERCIVPLEKVRLIMPQQNEANFKHIPSPDGRWLAWLGETGYLKLMDTQNLPNPPIELEIQEGVDFRIEFSPDGRWLAISN